MELIRVFAKRADLRREELGLSKTALAERLDVDHGAVSKLLSGTVRLQIDTLEKWAKALECDPAWLISQGDTIHAPAPTLDAQKLALISAILALNDTDFNTVQTAFDAVSKRFKKNEASAISG